nr:hypothetical protein TetV2_00445 [Oceanusvirus sp.]
MVTCGGGKIKNPLGAVTLVSRRWSDEESDTDLSVWRPYRPMADASESSAVAAWEEYFLFLLDRAHVIHTEFARDVEALLEQARAEIFRKVQRPETAKTRDRLKGAYLEYQSRGVSMCRGLCRLTAAMEMNSIQIADSIESLRFSDPMEKLDRLHALKKSKNKRLKNVGIAVSEAALALECAYYRRMLHLLVGRSTCLEIEPAEEKWLDATGDHDDGNVAVLHMFGVCMIRILRHKRRVDWMYDEAR